MLCFSCKKDVAPRSGSECIPKLIIGKVDNPAKFIQLDSTVHYKSGPYLGNLNLGKIEKEL